MELEPGYKQVEAGFIPEDWSSSSLVNLCVPGGLVRGPFGGNLKKECFVKEGYKVYEQRNAIYKSIEMGSYYIDQNKYLELKRFDVVPGDFIVSCSGTIGRIFQIPKDAKVGVINQALLKIKLNSSLVTSDYFYQVFIWDKFQQKIVDSTQGGAMQNLVGMDVFKNTFFPLPPLPEQCAIASALSDIDTLLSSLDSLLAKKRDIKQAVMQELLTGKQRLPGFSGEWKDCLLGSVGSFKKGKGIKKDEAASHGIPCIRYGEIYTRHNDYVKTFYSFIPRSIAVQSQPLKIGDLLFAGSGETSADIGKCVAFLGDAEAYAGGDIVIFSPVKQDSLYLGYLMNQPLISAQKSRMGQGDAVVHISAGSLAQLQIFLPPLPEQTAIAAVLSDMDAEIDTLTRRRDKTRALKQGMMQELLTGRTRLV